MKSVTEGVDPGPDLAEWLLAVSRRVPGLLAAGLYAPESADGPPRLRSVVPASCAMPVADGLLEPLLRHGGSRLQALDGDHCLVAHAYLPPGGLPGALVLHLAAPPADQARLSTLSGEVAREAWNSVTRARRPAPAATIDWNEVVAVSAAMLAQPDLDAAALALSNAVTERFGCDRVAVGLVLRADREPTLHACTPAVDWQAGRRLGRAIEAAMDECLAHGDAVRFPVDDAAGAPIVFAHQALAREARAQAVATVPLPRRSHSDGGSPVGVLGLERIDGPTFTADELARLRRIAAVAGPALALHLGARPSRWRRAGAAVGAWLRRQGIPVRAVWAGGTAAAVAISLGLAFVSVGYQVSAPARVEGVVQRALVAPTDGFIKAAHARPGDLVTEGTLLAEMAREELALAERRWGGDLAQAEGTYGAALAAHDRAQVVVQSARMEEAAAQLGLVRQQLARSEIRAPFDGVVIEGDLSQSLGAPARRGDVLMRIAPAGRWRVIVEVDERDIGPVEAGARGALVLSAQPGQAIALTVERITPVAASRDGRTFYEVEARPSTSGGAAPALLRPGMTGVARLDAGPRSLGWIATHRLIDAVRYGFWTLFG